MYFFSAFSVICPLYYFFCIKFSLRKGGFNGFLTIVFLVFRPISVFIWDNMPAVREPGSALRALVIYLALAYVL